ncbi:hypothetical protein AMECASPLE_008980 [Ameca splendens]|uniref:Uncharacterized protein n=1 Tax=Ameca splendens TaxID=208324 RepID=A0ABV0XD97_9TELE
MNYSCSFLPSSHSSIHNHTAEAVPGSSSVVAIINFYSPTPTYASLCSHTLFGFNSSSVRSLGVDPCHSGIEQALLRKVIGREPHLWRFPWASAICQRNVRLCH